MTAQVHRKQGFATGSTTPTTNALRMNKIPDTRQTLIERVKDADDHAAWTEFVMIYRPAVMRFALRRGLQLADAEDVAQRVFVAVARTLKHWDPRRSAGSFRAWLLTTTRNNVINALTRQPTVCAKGGTSALKAMNTHTNRTSIDEQLDWECQRAEFRKAASDIRREFSEDTWQAFWMTAMEERSVADVAKQLNKSTGSVYAARSRIIRRIKRRLEQLQSPVGGEQ